MFRFIHRKDGNFVLEVEKWVDSVGNEGEETSFLYLSEKEFEDLSNALELAKIERGIYGTSNS